MQIPFPLPVIFVCGARVLPGISFGAAGATAAGALAIAVPIGIGIAVAGLAVGYGLKPSRR